MSQERTAQGASRRDFIKQSSVVVGGALAGTLSVARSAHAAGSDELKIGLIGCGGRGNGATRDTLGINTGVKIHALADAFKDRVDGTYAGLLKDHGNRIDISPERRFHGFDAYQRLIDLPEIDVVILATPPGFRPIHFAAAVDAGKHIFMEKPVAVDAPGIRAVLEAGKKATERGLAVGVGLQRHHEKTYIETIKRLKDGAIGEILATRVYWNGAGVWVNPRLPEQTEMEYQMRNWYYFNWLCGDHICEQHIHNLDVSNWLMDDHPAEAVGMGGREVRTGLQFGEIYDHHAVEFTYANGAKMFSQCRHQKNTWTSISEHAIGSRGKADISGSRIDAIDQPSWKFKGASPNPYQIEHADLVAAIRSGTPYNEAEYGAHSTMTSIMGRMATYSGQLIKWDDAINSQISLSPKNYAWDADPPVLPDRRGRYKIAVPGQTKVI